MPSTLTYKGGYTWINQGEWRSGSHEGDAIEAVRQQALRDDKWDAVYEPALIVIRRLPCDERHIDACWHGEVEFYQAAQNNESETQ